LCNGAKWETLNLGQTLHPCCLVKCCYTTFGMVSLPKSQVAQDMISDEKMEVEWVFFYLLFGSEIE